MLSTFLISMLIVVSVIFFVIIASLFVIPCFQPPQIKNGKNIDPREVARRPAKIADSPYSIGTINNYVCTGPREHLHASSDLDAYGVPEKCHCGHSVEFLGIPRHRYSFSGNYMCTGPRHHVVDVESSSLPVGQCFCGHKLERLY